MTLGYRIDGAAGAPVLVFSPSLGTTTSLWEAQAERLAREFRIVRHDHPGHGISPLPSEPVTVAAIGEALIGVLDALAVSQASFCGISLGGMVGMWLGGNAPERIDRLVLASTGRRGQSRCVGRPGALVHACIRRRTRSSANPRRARSGSA